MRHISFSQFLLFVFVISMSSCDWLETDATTVSDNAKFISLSMSYDEDNPGISTGVFTVEKDIIIEDSIIVNIDSMPYNTRIDSVVPKFEFYSISATYLYVTKENGDIDTLLISESTAPDTVDFRWGVRVRNIAADESTEVEYQVKMNVHTVEPELYTWTKAVESLYDFTASSQKALSFHDSIYFYVSSGFTSSLYRSKDGYKWSDKINIPDLPLSAVTRNIVEFNDALYYAHRDDNLYTTTDGVHWTAKSFAAEDYKIVNLLFDLNDKLWGISQSKTDSKYRFVFSNDGVNWSVSSEIPQNFPIGDYAAHSFFSRTKVPKAIVVGGYNSSEDLLDNIWSTENGTYWIDFSTEENNLNSLAGASIVSYDDKLLMFGLMNEDGELDDDWYVESIDEGLSWERPDTTYNIMSQVVISGTDTSYIEIEPRYFTSLLTDENKRLVMIGGRNRSTFFNDVWVGKLNRLSFDIQ